MKKIIDPLFVTYCLLWCLIHFLRWIQHPLPWLNDYLTDFLFIPVIAQLTVTITRKFIVRNQSYSYPFSYLLGITLYAAIVFEYIMPHFSTVYTADWGDALAYLLGSVFYYYVDKHQKEIAYLKKHHDHSQF